MPQRSDLTLRPVAGLAMVLTVSLWLSVTGTVGEDPDAPNSGAALAAVILFTLAAVLTAVAAVRLIERIGHNQSSRPPVAWWASDQHLAGGH